MNVRDIVNAKTISGVAAAVVARDWLLGKAGLQKRPSTMASVGNALLLLGAGAAIGAGAALLLTPRTGAEMRSQLQSRAGEWTGKLTKKSEAGQTAGSPGM